MQFSGRFEVASACANYWTRFVIRKRWLRCPLGIVRHDVKHEAGHSLVRSAFQGAISELFSRSLLVLKTWIIVALGRIAALPTNNDEFTRRNDELAYLLTQCGTFATHLDLWGLVRKWCLKLKWQFNAFYKKFSLNNLEGRSKCWNFSKVLWHILQKFKTRLISGVCTGVMLKF